jgi:hypothetical protein
MPTVVETPETATSEELILDRLLPVSDATVSHHVVVDAPAERVWAALEQLDLMEVLRSSRGARALIAAREIPVRLLDRLRGRTPPPPPEQLRLNDFRPWVVLGERESRELVVGAIGRFWGPGIEWLDIEPADFAAFDRQGYGKIAWGFAIFPCGENRSFLVDECRTRVTDPVSRRRFRAYWRLVGPGASYVMRQTVALVKRHAEQAERA